MTKRAKAAVYRTCTVCEASFTVASKASSLPLHKFNGKLCLGCISAKPKAKPAPSFTPIDPAVLNTEQQFKWQERLATQSAAVRSAKWLGGAPPEDAPASQRLRILSIMPDLEVSSKTRDKITECMDELTDEQERVMQRREKLADLKLHERLMAYLGEGSLCSDIVLDRVWSEFDIHGVTDTEVTDVVDGFQQTRPVDVFSYDLVFVEVDLAATRARSIVAAVPNSKLVLVIPHAKVQSNIRTSPATITALLRVTGDLVQERRSQLAMPWASVLPFVPRPSEDDAYLDSLN